MSAEVFRYLATNDSDALAKAWHYYDGMRILNDITGIKGLFARSFLFPNETHPPGGAWTNSTVPQFAGWTWKTDSSSDELVGHMLTFTVRGL